TPDGKTLYFVRSTPGFNFWTILVSQFKNGKWNTPEVAPFSGQYSDADPFITPDGAKLFFISDRPTTAKPKSDTDIWMMEKTASGAWGEPKNLESINSDTNEWYPTIAENGTLYFGSERAGGFGSSDIYRSRFADGKYQKPENLGDAINTGFNEYEPFIAPDESFLIFVSCKRADSVGGCDIYVSYNRNGAWTKPKNLGDKINSNRNEYSPKISLDGKYFFWTSCRDFTTQPTRKKMNYNELMNRLNSAGNGLGDIYRIDVSALKLER
ncbi:MAG: TolB family protein, partial [Pyrinomonadaceae bacterium]